MRWLLHGNITPAAGEALRRHQHETRTPADIGVAPEASPDEMLRAAHKHQLDLLTTDQSLATRIFEEPFRFDRCIVYLHLGDGDVEQDDAIDRLFERYKSLTSGRLYTVTGSRVKIRQLPTRLG